MAVLLTSLAALAGLAATLALSWLIARATRGCAKVPIHWGIDLKPDSFAPRWVAISMMPGLQLAMLGLMVLLPRLHLPTHGDPRIASWMLGLVLPCAQVLFFVLLRRWRDGTEP